MRLRLFLLTAGVGVAVSTLTVSLTGIIGGRPFELLPGAVGTETPLLPSWSSDSFSIADVQNADMRLLLVLTVALGLLTLSATLLNEVARFLIQGVARRLPLAIQFSLGANRGHLFRTFGRSGLRYVFLGTLAALPVAITLAAGIDATWPAGNAPGTLSFRLLAVWLAASVLIAGTLLLVVVNQTKTRLLERAFVLLRAGTRATASPAQVLSRSTVAVVQVALVTIVLGTAVMLLRAFGPPERVGGNAVSAGDDTLMIQLHVERSESWRADPSGTLQRVTEDLYLLPGVEAVSGSSQGALLGVGEVRRVTTVCAECFRGTMPRAINIGTARVHVVSADFLGTTPISSGEIHGPGHVNPGEVQVNRAFAYQLFPNGDPLGKRLRIGERPEKWLEVVGVLPDILEPGVGSPGEAPPAIYLAAGEHPTAIRNLIVRFDGNAEPFIPSVEDSLRKHGIESGWSGTISRFETEFRAPLRWFAWLFGILAVTVALIAAAGVHETMHFLANQRSREVGVRVALGATRRQIRQLVVSEGIRLSGLGAYLGVIFLGGIARMLELRFAGPRLFDPVLYLGLPGALTILAIAASWGAATRAAALEPAQSMK